MLTAKPGYNDALRRPANAPGAPRQELGNLDYALFQLRDAPDTFLYARIPAQSGSSGRAYRPAALPGLLLLQMDSLLAGPLRLDYLTPVAFCNFLCLRLRGWPIFNPLSSLPIAALNQSYA